MKKKQREKMTKFLIVFVVIIFLVSLLPMLGR
ncbi:DUF4044 domain-containing protein [Clostridium fermenticellae]|uniref:DUF4044 domain-containing protein n=1 Tax=Clostridium fermenticellae TaxID=2068654 RepID=A0A386H2Y6_9CLOT|nr:DUF4044 domain-containing protein [Clostridium fermenticellae]